MNLHYSLYDDLNELLNLANARLNSQFLIQSGTIGDQSPYFSVIKKIRDPLQFLVINLAIGIKFTKEE